MKPSLVAILETKVFFLISGGLPTCLIVLKLFLYLGQYIIYKDKEGMRCMIVISPKTVLIEMPL